MKKEKTLGVYVPSYKRSNKIITEHLLNSCTYVVRKSEEELYKAAGVKKVWAVEDSLINNMTKTRQYIIDNAPEDIVMQIDDDISSIMYRLEDTEIITDKDVIDMEFIRIAQLLEDLHLGFASITVTAKPWSYTQEFQFAGLCGGIYWFNREWYKAEMDEKADVKEDTDKVLQELLHNRIILIPKYLAMNAGIDTNEGGDNINKNMRKIVECNEYMKIKWGRYYEFDEKKNTPKIAVKR